MADTDSDVIYRAPNISVSRRKIVAGQTTFAVSSIQSVWVNRYSLFATWVTVLGLALIAYGLSMSSCTGIFIAAVAGKDFES